MKLVASVLACALLIVGAVEASAAKKDKEKEKDAGAGASAKPALVGSFGDWKVYHSGAGKARICYLLAEPKSRDPDDAKREKAYAFISDRPAEHVHNEISFVMGFDVSSAAEAKEPKEVKKKDKKGKKDDEAPESVSPTAAVGDADFDLVAKGADLFVKNPAEESKVIDEMRKGASLVIKAPARRGHAVTDSYSLSGFSQAIDKAVKDCAGS